MKALEKDRNRRYDSPSRLAADVEWYLSGELIEACPPTLGYRMKKFAGRHGAFLTSAMFVTVAIVIGAGVSLWQAIEANDARRMSLNLHQMAIFSGLDVLAIHRRT